MPRGASIAIHELPDWMEQGACKGRSNIFFPHNIIEQERAIRICKTCPVLYECDQYAIRNREKDGVWGGKMRGSLFYPERERKK